MWFCAIVKKYPLLVAKTGCLVQNCVTFLFPLTEWRQSFLIIIIQHNRKSVIIIQHRRKQFFSYHPSVQKTNFLIIIIQPRIKPFLSYHSSAQLPSQEESQSALFHLQPTVLQEPFRNSIQFWACVPVPQPCLIIAQHVFSCHTQLKSHRVLSCSAEWFHFCVAVELLNKPQND